MAIRSGDTGHASEPGLPPARATRDVALGAGWPRPPLVTRGFTDRHVPGTGGPLRWLFSSIWLVYLVQPVSELFKHHHGGLWIGGGLAITAAFCVIYAPVIIDVDRRPRLSRAGLVVLVLLAALASVVYGQDWTPLWIYVSAAAGMILAATSPRRVALLGVLFVGACYAFFGWLSHLSAGNFFAVLLPVVLVGLAMIGFRMQIMLMHELAQARGAVAKLAANEERLRLARDMHDLTGQSLSMITLKSDLAAKRLTRLPESGERDAVLTELGDIARVSRQTLHDIREAVSGYRRPTLAIEVITARNALEAAGVGLDDDPELTLRSGTFDPDAEAVLAWCLREAVTNVIRHAGAGTCRIRLVEHGPELSLEVTDDGRGFIDHDAPCPDGQQDPDAHKDPDARKDPDGQTTRGSGLRGMSERLSAVGGHLALGPSHVGPSGRSSGFRLTATLNQDPAALSATATSATATSATTADDNCQL
jgi:two-component system sensor histidine kinase DesK